jgi:hypothetical protein
LLPSASRAKGEREFVSRFSNLVTLQSRSEEDPTTDAFLQIEVSYVFRESTPKEDSQADLMPDFRSGLGAVSHAGPTMDAPRIIAGEDPPAIPVRIEQRTSGATDRTGGAPRTLRGLHSVPYDQEGNRNQCDFRSDHVKGPQVLLEKGEMVQRAMGQKVSRQEGQNNNEWKGEICETGFLTKLWHHHASEKEIERQEDDDDRQAVRPNIR